MGNEMPEVDDQGNIIVTVDLSPGSFGPPTVHLLAGPANGKGWTSRVPEDLWVDYLDLLPRWEALQTALREAVFARPDQVHAEGGDHG